MHYHIIMTEICNSKCTYCYKKSMEEENDLSRRFKFDLDAPHVSDVDVLRLKKFLSRDKDPVLIFYGGEPLLQIDKIKEIMDNIDARFMIQTNGKLLREMGREYLLRFEKMLVSLDGNRARTDENKGAGTYNKVISNLKWLRAIGFRGEIVARMVIDQKFGDVFEQVKYLSDLCYGESLKEGNLKGFKNLSNSVIVKACPQNRSGNQRKLFDSVHWQLDMGFYRCDYNKTKIEKFVHEYNKSLKNLIDYWMDEMRHGSTLKFYPFVGIMESLLSCKKTRLRCGSGYMNYTITTNGNLVACPIMGCMTNFYCGNLDSKPGEFKKFDVGGTCTHCSYLDLCGGRCLYVNAAKLWPEEGLNLICDTIKYLIDCLRERVDEVKELIEKGVVRREDFEYEKYFGPEIIP